MPDPAPTRRESSKAVPVGEPPTPEGWTPQDSRDVVLAIQVVYKDSPGKATRLVAGLLDQMRPVGGAGQELHEAAQAFLDAYIDTDREHTTGEWEVLDAAEEELRQALAAGVGGTGVRLTDEEAKAGVYALGKAYGGNLISGPQHSLYNKLGKLRGVCRSRRVSRRRLRRVLGRIGSGAAVAALPLAAALTGAAQGWCLFTILTTVLLATVLLFTFAPWIPWVRRFVPARRRFHQLEVLWSEGFVLTVAVVTSAGQYQQWLKEREEWHERAAKWIEKHIGGVEAARFARPTGVLAVSHRGAHTPAHGDALTTIGAQLNVLIRLRDEQRIQA